MSECLFVLIDTSNTLMSCTKSLVKVETTFLIKWWSDLFHIYRKSIGGSFHLTYTYFYVYLYMCCGELLMTVIFPFLGG